MIFHNSYKSQKIQFKMLKRKQVEARDSIALACEQAIVKNATKIVNVNKYLLEHDYKTFQCNSP